MNQLKENSVAPAKAFLSPVVNRGFRKPFGELTNTPPSSHKRTDLPSRAALTPTNVGRRSQEKTPSKANNGSSSTPNSKAELTPLANLKLLMRVASESASMQQQQQDKPSRRELFKDGDEGEADMEEEEDRENVENVASQQFLLSQQQQQQQQQLQQQVDGQSRLVIDDHDYSSDKSAVQTPTSTSSFCSPFNTPASSGFGSTGNSVLNASTANNKVSRKDKSLGLLCDKFIGRFPAAVPNGEKCEVQLDDLAKQMGTERRRIYDIVNVLESVQMMTKIGKNLYQWHGTTHQRMTLARLKQIGAKFEMTQRYLSAKADEQAATFPSSIVSPGGDSLCSTPGGLLNSSCNSSVTASPLSTTSSSAGRTPVLGGQSPSPSGPVERKTSLGKACQRFLMLFLVLPEQHGKVNLELAARVIHGHEQETVMKTRIRRLYDIANILQSLRLIQKVQITEQHGGKKPAFQYIGPNVDGVEVTREALETLPTSRQRHSLLAIGKNLLNLPDDPPATATAAAIPPATALSYFSLSKKRSTPDSGFSSPLEPQPKLARAQSDNFTFAVPQHSPSSSANAAFRRTSSLLDLSNAAEAASAERQQQQQQRTKPPSPLVTSGIIANVVNGGLGLGRPSPNTQRRLLQLRPITSVQSQRQLFKQSPVQRSTVILSPSLSPNTSTAIISPSGSVSLLKRALATPPSPQSQPQDLSLKRRRASPVGASASASATPVSPVPVYPRTKKQQVMRLIGLAKDQPQQQQQQEQTATVQKPVFTRSPRMF